MQDHRQHTPPGAKRTTRWGTPVAPAPGHSAAPQSRAEPLPQPSAAPVAARAPLQPTAPRTFDALLREAQRRTPVDSDPMPEPGIVRRTNAAHQPPAPATLPTPATPAFAIDDLPGTHNEPVFAAPAPLAVPAPPQRRHAPSRPTGQGARPSWMRMQIILPVAIVLGLLGGAMFLQPGGGEIPEASGQESDDSFVTALETPTAGMPSPTNTTAPATTVPGTITPVPANLTVNALVTQQAGNGNSEVAGVQATPTQDTLPRTSQTCGGIQEVATPLSVEQSLQGISVRATQATSYPIEYLRCILSAAGSTDASNIATALDKAYQAGATQAVVIDLWVANSTRDFAQVNLKTASVAAAGQNFAPIATLNGKSEVVVAGGQGRTISLVVAITNTLAPTPGSMTVSVDAPLIGGKETQGKYQLFLPTP